MVSFSLFLALALSLIDTIFAATIKQSRGQQCQQTKVLILGAGTAGITAAQTLSNRSVTDFIIVEYNDDIGGRVKHTNFGTDPQGKPYTIELGANWVQGIQSKGGKPNPIWTLAKKYNLVNTYSDYSNISTYDKNGATNYTNLFDDYETAYAIVERNAGYTITRNLQDKSAIAGFAIAGWTPRQDVKKQAIDWFEWDFEYATPPARTSELFGIVNFNTTFYQYSDENNFVHDPRGFNAFIKGMASTFLTPNDPRLKLNTIVSDINYDGSGVTVHNTDGTCIRASYAICTFSLGVLQASLAKVAPVSFHPQFPAWKRRAIETFQMATYTKMFLQFDEAFWPEQTQFFLYAHPTLRGRYVGWQSLTPSGFLPGSNIIFVTVVDEESYRVEAQTDEETLPEILAVLSNMFGVDVPQPKAFFYPRWTETPWAFGSYSNWPVGTTLEQHQNLRASLGRLLFAGEATHPEYFGFLHGAFFEGQEAGRRVARCVKGICPDDRDYRVLHGTTTQDEYNPANGWDVTSFQTIGFE